MDLTYSERYISAKSESSLFCYNSIFVTFYPKQGTFAIHKRSAPKVFYTFCFGSKLNPEMRPQTFAICAAAPLTRKKRTKTFHSRHTLCSYNCRAIFASFWGKSVRESWEKNPGNRTELWKPRQKFRPL
ncbi:hypothetical protein CDAR_117221 [Caerostris darwini]|uniref:Uncharacterized protein n=1 Tax=Caerostris darwini TaxID=1538125 RepID=A0AAV4U5I6_9ARAC|nr:hypothetical protein CDAR_117221 [Caerostris darwini]